MWLIKIFVLVGVALYLVHVYNTATTKADQVAGQVKQLVTGAIQERQAATGANQPEQGGMIGQALTLLKNTVHNPANAAQQQPASPDDCYRDGYDQQPGQSVGQQMRQYYSDMPNQDGNGHE